MNNVSVIDRPFSTLMNTGMGLLNAAAVHSNQAPIKPTVINATVPTSDQIERLGVDNAELTDLVAEVRFDMLTQDGIAKRNMYILGYLVTQRFEDNKVATPYDLLIKHYNQYGTALVEPIIYDRLSRNPQVEPSAGANSASEYIILSVQPGEIFTYNNSTFKYAATSEQQQGYALPIAFSNHDDSLSSELGIVKGSALIFKNQAAVPQTLTVTPIICSSNTTEDIIDIVCAGLAL